MRVSLTQFKPIQRLLGASLSGVVGWLSGPGKTKKLITAAVTLGIVAYPLAAVRGWHHAIWYTLVYIGWGCWRAYDEVSPKHMQLLREGYNQRKVALYGLLQGMQRKRLGSRDVEDFQSRALLLLVSYVRNHRQDTTGLQIYANLIVVEHGTAMVVARDSDHREPRSRFPCTDTVIAQALATGEAAYTGDLYADFPSTPPGKSYRSILAIPLFSHDKRIIGVVSVDSSRKYHFERDRKELVAALMPYASLLSWTLTKAGPGSTTKP